MSGVRGQSWPTVLSRECRPLTFLVWLGLRSGGSGRAAVRDHCRGDHLSGRARAGDADGDHGRHRCTTGCPAGNASAPVTGRLRRPHLRQRIPRCIRRSVPAKRIRWGGVSVTSKTAGRLTDVAMANTSGVSAPGRYARYMVWKPLRRDHPASHLASAATIQSRFARRQDRLRRPTLWAARQG